MERCCWALCIFVLLATIFAPSRGFGCTQCPPEFEGGFDESAAEADLIIIGRRIYYPPDEVAWLMDIEVWVEEVLAGRYDGRLIRVDSGESMCSYGIVVDDARYVMILKYGWDSGPPSWGPISPCHTKVLPVWDSHIYLDGKAVPIAEFRKMLKSLRPSSPVITDAPVDMQPSRDVTEIRAWLSSSLVGELDRESFDACMDRDRPRCFEKSEPGGSPDISCITETMSACKTESRDAAGQHERLRSRLEQFDLCVREVRDRCSTFDAASRCVDVESAGCL